MASDRIMKQWEEFAAAVMPPEPAVNQVNEMRRAFFAGATAMLSVLREITDDVDEDAGVEILEGLHVEGNEFAKGILDGRF